MLYFFLSSFFPSSFLLSTLLSLLFLVFLFSSRGLAFTSFHCLLLSFLLSSFRFLSVSFFFFCPFFFFLLLSVLFLSLFLSSSAFSFCSEKKQRRISDCKTLQKRNIFCCLPRGGKNQEQSEKELFFPFSLQQTKNLHFCSLRRTKKKKSFFFWHFC